MIGQVKKSLIKEANWKIAQNAATAKIYDRARIQRRARKFSNWAIADWANAKLGCLKGHSNPGIEITMGSSVNWSYSPVSLSLRLTEQRVDGKSRKQHPHSCIPPCIPYCIILLQALFYMEPYSLPRAPK